ncbi:hypothetical protein ACWCXX_34250 [Streptomyces sp. NPDC001732]
MDDSLTTLRHNRLVLPLGPDEEADEMLTSDSRPTLTKALGALRFSEERDPAMSAGFVRLRVIDPARAYRRRGVEAAIRGCARPGARRCECRTCT